MARRWDLVLGGLLALLVAPAGADEIAPGAYDLSVWVDALFGPDGGLRQYSFVDEARYPGPFLDRLRERLAQARIRPVVEQGRPVTFQTGVRLSVQVVPAGGGGSVTLRGLSVGPLVLKTYAASYPRDIGATPGWNGRVTAICTVAVDGRCRTVATRAVPGIPESVRRFAIASMEGWRYKPQEVDGVAVEGGDRGGVRPHDRGCDARGLPRPQVRPAREDPLTRVPQPRKWQATQWPSLLCLSSGAV